MTRQPSGTVTFLFTDIEGSTKLLDEFGPERYADALDLHRSLLREAFERHHGYEVDCEGDAFFVSFGSAAAAVGAAAEAQQALAEAAWPEDCRIRVRMGLHTGEPVVAPPKYVGMDVHRAARIMAAAHGGQVVLSATTMALLEPSSVELYDLGEHRLKDLSSPIRLYQLQIDGLARAFPALRTLQRSNLPVPATPFVGRERELRELVSRLTGDARLLTLTGPGGTGKTRLAIHAAAEAADSFPDGIFWVGLAPVREPSGVLQAVAHVLEVEEESGRALVETLSSAQAGKRAAIVLDNVEHLLPDAAISVAALATACTTTTVLATSRERLQVAIETAWPVPPLSPSDGEQLFVERARAAGVEVKPDATVAEICRRLDELPLAIELAAARTVVFSPEEVLQRLSQRLDLLEGTRDADPRQQTLRATIDWSHELLGPEERQLFARMSVFATCSEEAATRICGADSRTLQSLIDKSLVRRRDDDLGSRYWLLETIREYAAEKLVESGEADAIQARLRSDLLGLVESVSFCCRDMTWLRNVAAEADNIVAALAVEPASEGQLRLAGTLADYWYWAGRATDGRAALERLLEALPDAPESTRTRAECAAGLLAMLQDDFPAAEWFLDRGGEVAERRGMHAEQVIVLFSRGMISHHRQELEHAERFLRKALDLAERHGLVQFYARIMRRLSLIAFAHGDAERGRGLQEAALAAARGTDDLLELLVLSDLAWQAVVDGDYELAVRLGSDGLESPFLDGASDAALEHTLAVAFLGLGRASEAEEAAASALRKSWARRNVTEIAVLLDALAGAAAAREADARAARLSAAAAQLFAETEISDTDLQIAHAVYGGFLDAARERAGSAWDIDSLRGKALEPDAAVAFALSPVVRA